MIKHKLSWKNFTALEGLRLLGHDTNKPCRGTVLVRLGPTKSRHYAFRHRVRDGRIMTRRGRLVSAQATYEDGELLIVTFETA